MRQDRVNMVFNFYGYNGGGMAGSVYDKSGISPCLTTNGGGGREPMITSVYET